MKAFARFLEVVRSILIALISTAILVSVGVYAVATITTPSYLLVVLFLLFILLSNILAKNVGSLI